jgi:hypothetical protein
VLIYTIESENGIGERGAEAAFGAESGIAMGHE